MQGRQSKESNRIEWNRIDRTNQADPMQQLRYIVLLEDKSHLEY